MIDKDLADLLDERNALKRRIPEIEQELKKANARLNELCDGYRREGLISQKYKEVRNQKFPLWNDTGFLRSRIIAITDKWISIRHDCSPDDDVKQYCRTTGREKGTRKTSTWNTPLDVFKALAIWETHQKSRA